MTPSLDDVIPGHLKPGMALPAVPLQSTNGGEVCLATHPGQSVLAVYPWTGRPGQPNPPNWDLIPGAHGSTPELEGFRDLFDEFAKRGIAIYGLSNQPTGYQREMAERLGLPFPILSDAGGRLASALALPIFMAGEETYLKRLTIIVANGRIELVFYPVAEPALHAGDVLAWLAQSPSASSSASSTE
jgi:peroxiredoxin